MYHRGSEVELGERGWLQRANFFLMGLGVLGFALGVDQALDSIVGAVLLSIFGFGLIVAGVFTPRSRAQLPGGANRAFDEADLAGPDPPRSRGTGRLLRGLRGMPRTGPPARGPLAALNAAHRGCRRCHDHVDRARLPEGRGEHQPRAARPAPRLLVLDRRGGREGLADRAMKDAEQATTFIDGLPGDGDLGPALPGRQSQGLVPDSLAISRTPCGGTLIPTPSSRLAGADCTRPRPSGRHLPGPCHRCHHRRSRSSLARSPTPSATAPSAPPHFHRPLRDRPSWQIGRSAFERRVIDELLLG
jgi:uncharacterized protein DUF998